MPEQPPESEIVDLLADFTGRETDERLQPLLVKEAARGVVPNVESAVYTTQNRWFLIYAIIETSPVAGVVYPKIPWWQVRAGLPVTSHPTDVKEILETFLKTEGLDFRRFLSRSEALEALTEALGGPAGSKLVEDMGTTAWTPAPSGVPRRGRAMELRCGISAGSRLTRAF